MVGYQHTVCSQTCGLGKLPLSKGSRPAPEVTASMMKIGDPLRSVRKNVTLEIPRGLLFDEGQNIFAINRSDKALGKKSSNPSLLAGLITDPRVSYGKIYLNTPYRSRRGDARK